MANRWGIPKDVEIFVKERGFKCVYCGVDFSTSNKSRKTKPTWEHIINDIRMNSVDNVALCCTSCNASKGAKELSEWLKSKYCMLKGISKNTVASVVRRTLEKQ